MGEVGELVLHGMRGPQWRQQQMQQQGPRVAGRLGHLMGIDLGWE